jgi:hypothetical protein
MVSLRTLVTSEVTLLAALKSCGMDGAELSDSECARGHGE